jgi:hypothetical protein
VLYLYWTFDAEHATNYLSLQVHLLVAALYFFEFMINILAGETFLQFDSVLAVIATVDASISLWEIVRAGELSSQPSQPVRILRSLRMLHSLKIIRYASSICLRQLLSLF